MIAGVATASHEGFQWPPEDESFAPGIGTQFPPGVQAKRDAITGPAEVYMFQGFLAHGTPPAYNTPEELAENIEAVRAALAEDCQRTENGFHTGTSGDAIANGFANPVFKVITGIEDLRWTVDLAKNQAFARFSLFTLRSPHPTLIGERFKVIDGKVTEIEAFFSIPAGSVPICDVVPELCP
jgi:hypothetical protein